MSLLSGVCVVALTLNQLSLTHRYFADQPVNHPDVTDAMLTLWWFEDWLKKYFFNVLQLLEVSSILKVLRLYLVCLVNSTPHQDSLARLAPVCTNAGDDSHIPTTRWKARTRAELVASSC